MRNNEAAIGKLLQASFQKIPFPRAVGYLFGDMEFLSGHGFRIIVPDPHELEGKCTAEVKRGVQRCVDHKAGQGTAPCQVDLVAIDLRRSSPVFGRHVAVELDSEKGEMLWIPPGFGHAFLALTEVVGLAYKVTDYYSPASERTIAWNDPDLQIPWPIDAGTAIISDKDRRGVALKDAELFS